ncbi:hypothetical protein [Methanoplanus endosymbiosus]|uniref:Uncharacterized protein n=1 Tax=Methanoplanus endosymbiosus TaxID=33865 RepID=A0A9E7PPE9_9EURY|nr:hypothetical protein [Methanoplanus endosymbiosus]UUX91207.1 hypothetical protein L6E24_07390 [Methanoplanus endosymbiosus]
MGHKRGIQDKIKALSEYLNVNPARITESEGTLYSFKALYYGPNTAYLVLTDIEANVAARRAIKSRLWVITLEAAFEYFGIESYPADALEKLKHQEIREINAGIYRLVEATCGAEILSEKMLSLGNRANILADYDQTERKSGEYYIYRLF